MSEASLQAFMASALRTECLLSLRTAGEVSVPVTDDFVEQLVAYARARVASVNADALRTQLGHFKRGTAFKFDLTVGENEGYVDVTMGEQVDGRFVPGEFVTTAFEFDGAVADRASYPLVRKYTRAWAEDDETQVTWNGVETPMSHAVFAVTLLTVGRAAQAFATQLRASYPLTYLATVTQTTQRAFVCDAPALFEP